MKRFIDFAGRTFYVAASFDRTGWWHTLPNGNTHHHWLTIGRRCNPESPGAHILMCIVGPLLLRFGWGQPSPSILKEQTK